MVIALLVFAAFLVAPEAGAQSQLDESTFLSSAMAQEHVSAVLSERVSSARGELSRAGLYTNPELGFEREAPRGGIEQDTWSISWTPPLDGRILARRRAARAGLRAAEFDLESSRLALRGELRADFAGWALAHERARVASGLLKLVERLAAAMSAQASQGEASGLAARRLALAQVEIQSEEARAAAAVESAHARIRGWGVEMARSDAPIRPPLPPMPADSVLGGERPEVQARRQEVEQARLLAGLANRFWALPELSFGWQTIREDHGDLEGPIFGVRWPLPLFDRQQAERVEGKGRFGAAQGRARLAEARARANLDAALAGYSKLRHSAEAALETEAAGERVVESAIAVFEAGESDVTDLLESLRGVLSARMATLDLYAAALEAHRDLERAVGRPLSLTEGATK